VLWVDGAKEIEIEGELKRDGDRGVLARERREAGHSPPVQEEGATALFSLIRRPLFPNYLFRLPPDEAQRRLGRPVLGVKGVQRGRWANDGHAIPIPAAEPIEALRKAVEEGDFDAAVIEAERLAALVGQPVTIRKGAFAGHAATVVEASPKSVTAEIDIMGRKTRLKLARKEIET
jgi:transcription antitermination factor NusG